ncbi:MAG: hypothetical protein ABS70_01490 [Nitrospira sp. SCN 59-13]|nr:MAG: hypothetical protein ABS70_01490 [Nitrospira sp. SCN 59-13]
MPDTSHPRSAQRRVGIPVLLVCYLNLTACSIFAGSSQSLTVNSEPPGANVLINGTLAGSTPLQHQVPRRGDLTVEVQKAGYTPQTRVTGRKLSSVGIVDVIGGAMFLLPLLGLIAPGAWEQDPGIIGVTLEPDHPQPAQPQ